MKSMKIQQWALSEKAFLPLVPFPSVMTTAQFLLSPSLRKERQSDKNIKGQKVTDDTWKHYV